MSRSAALAAFHLILLVLITCTQGALADGQTASRFRGEPLSLHAFGIRIEGTWDYAQTLPALKLRAVNPRTDAAPQLTVTFPDMERDRTRCFAITDREQDFRWTPPLIRGGNPRNTYDIRVRLKLPGGAMAQQVIQLRGKDSPDWNRTIETKDAHDSSIIGTGVHFNFAFEPKGDFAGWHDYPKIMALMAKAGIKFYRDDYWIYREEREPHPKFPHFIRRLKLAKAMGFKTIALIPMFADRDGQNVAANLADFVRATGNLVDVYELGNEPHNFGNWIPAFGGNWNAHDGNGKTSNWLKKFREVTNVAATELRKIRPDAIIIGGGAVTSANHHFLSGNLSPAINGIADHPYSNMTPPEWIAFGIPMNHRDGVVAGDANLTFNGIIDAYAAKFKAIGRPDLSLWFTEFGYSTFRYDGKGEEAPYGFAAYSEEAQAAYLMRRFLLCMKRPEVKAALQYDFMDDFNGKTHNAEANFGLVRADLSPKPAYHAMQRLTTLFNGAKPLPDSRITVLTQVLQRAARRDLLVDWDRNGQALIKATNDIRTAYFQTDTGLKLALWSEAPLSAEFAPRVARLKIRGQAKANGTLVGIELVSGRRFDIPSRADGQDLIITVAIGNSPLAIVF